MTAQAPTGFRMTGRLFLGIIVTFFVVIIGLDVWFASLAYTTYSGDVASNPYEAGIAFNKTLAQRRREASLGWRVEADASQPGLIALTLRDRAGTPLDGLTIAATLTRPATETGKKILIFKAAGPGRYAAQTETLTGAWDLTATATSPAGETFELADRIERK